MPLPLLSARGAPEGEDDDGSRLDGPGGARHNVHLERSPRGGDGPARGTRPGRRAYRSSVRGRDASPRPPARALWTRSPAREPVAWRPGAVPTRPPPAE